MGVETTIVVQSPEKVAQQVNNHAGYDVVLLGEKSESDPDRYSNWHSTQKVPTGLNITGLDNRRVDKALEDGRKALTEEDRQRAYESFQLYLAKDAPVIWLYQSAYMYLTSNKVHGVQLDELWRAEDRFSHLNKWYINTQKRT